MPADILEHLPQGWVGIFAIVTALIYISAQIVEKYEIIAKHVPFGTWWHKRQQKHDHRKAWVAEDNEVITELQTQVAGVVADLAAVNTRLRAFTAWSVYDARYHHRIEVDHANNGTCLLPMHYDFFEFEALWRRDPAAAAVL